MGLLLVLALGAPADAAPSADLVVVWAPGASVTPVSQAARAAGAAVLDRSPPRAGAANTAQLVQSGIDAFARGDLDQAWSILEQARSDVDRDGAAGLTRAQLSDLFLYRGQIKSQQGDTNAAWEELVVANTIDQTRDLDPNRFPPHVRAEFERARESVKKRERVEIHVSSLDGCRVRVDGSPTLGPIQAVVGRHWYQVTCPDRQPEGQRFELTTPFKAKIEPAPFVPPSDTELLDQARRSGARAFIVAEVHVNVATARLVGLDGRERDRRTVSIYGSLDPLADAVAVLLAPPASQHWYQSKWAWVAGGGVIAAVIAVPLTALLSRDTGSTDLRVNVPNPPGWAP